jgi:hypothetical protein
VKKLSGESLVILQKAPRDALFLTGIAETAAKGRDVFSQILTLRTEMEQQVGQLGKRAPMAC